MPFENTARHHEDTARNLSQIKTHVAEHWRVSQRVMHTNALVLGQKADSIEFVRLIGSQRVRVNLSNLQPFFSSVRELSVSLRGDGNGETVKVPVVWP